MFEFFIKLKDIWDEYSFEIIFILIILFFVCGSIYRKIKGENGSWSNQYFYDRFWFLKDDKQHHNYPQTNSGRFRKDSKGEVECRRILEKIFRRPFNKIRPNFLSNPVTDGNYNLEIDCYNDELKLGVEYDGIGHYKYTPFFHKNKEAFYNQKYRDELKNRMCKDNGIILIRVPYTVKHEDIEEYLVNELRKYYRF